MADLTIVDEKLGEVLGLARAAVEATRTIRGLTDDELRTVLQTMNEEAREAATRCENAAKGRSGRATKIIELGRSTRAEAADMMSTYLDGDADVLDGFEFLVMAEAGEVGHWDVLRTLADSAADAELRDLADWALPSQERHLATVRRCSIGLAACQDPLAVA